MKLKKCFQKISNAAERNKDNGENNNKKKTTTKQKKTHCRTTGKLRENFKCWKNLQNI